MSTTINKEQETKQLPQLIKQSSTYKMIIPAKVEEKIRYLCRKFPTLEWSGVLFTSHTGSFEAGDLTITCEDIHPMDLGSPGFTQFKMDETVAAYMADHLELFSCDCQLIHSHNSMASFFSGQDQTTLREEGDEKNCFISLIVNNAGEYCAAVTRKLQLTKKVTVETSGVSYEFFGEGRKELTHPIEPIEQVSDETVIQYYMLDIEKEEVTNPLSYLDDRFDEIEQKKAQTRRVYAPAKMEAPWDTREDDKDFTFRDYLNKPKKEEPKEQYIFDKDTMDELKAEQVIVLDPTAIHACIVKMITCSFIVDTQMDLKQWIVRHMDKKYDEIFTIIGSFDTWAEFIVEWLIENYYDESLTVEEYDEHSALVAQAMYDELFEYSGQNKYIDRYLDILLRWTD